MADQVGFSVVNAIMVSVGRVGHNPFVVRCRVDEVERRGGVGLDKVGLLFDFTWKHLVYFVIDLVIKRSGTSIVCIVLHYGYHIWRDIVDGVIDVDAVP